MHSDLYCLQIVCYPYAHYHTTSVLSLGTSFYFILLHLSSVFLLSVLRFWHLALQQFLVYFISTHFTLLPICVLFDSPPIFVCSLYVCFSVLSFFLFSFILLSLLSFLPTSIEILRVLTISQIGHLPLTANHLQSSQIKTILVRLGAFHIITLKSGLQ